MKKTMWFLGLILVMIFTWFAVMLYSNRGEPTGELEKVWRGWQGEAKKQPYSVIQSVLEKNGIHFAVRYRLKKGLDLEDYDALILSSQSTLRNEKDKDYLISWVRHGGHLLISGQNELAQEFGVEWRSFDDEKTVDESKNDKNIAKKNAVESEDNVEDSEDTVIPSTSGEQCKIPHNFLEKCHTEKKGVLRWENEEGVVFYPQARLSGSLQQSSMRKRHQAKAGKFCEGKIFIINNRFRSGRVTIFAHDIDIWANAESFMPKGLLVERELVPIARGDNAAYLHDLLDGDENVLTVRGDVWGGSNADWHLPEKKWWALYAAAVLMLLTVLLFFGRRFGALLEVENTQIADFSQHLQAAGRYWEDNNSYGWLAQNARQRLQFDLETQRRRFSNEEKLIKTLSTQCQQPVEGIIQVLSGKLPQSESEFVQFMAIVEEIRMVL